MSTNHISQQNAEQRYSYLINEVVSSQTVWVLTDEYGCVMLNTDDEDCLPIWPTEAFAQAWATDEWQHCQAQAISLTEWQKKWTSGLTDDELMLVIFPNADHDGYILHPQEFEHALLKKQQKLTR